MCDGGMVSKNHCADGLYCFASGGGWWLSEVEDFRKVREFRGDVL